MANDDTPSIIASWPPEGLTLELAVERTIGSLTPLYAAAAGCRDIGIIGSGFRARHPQNNSGDLPPYFEDKLGAEIILERVQNKIFSPFRTLLTTGELVVAIRPLSDLGAPLQLLHTDETSQLTIKMHHSQNSLTLCGPDAKELYGLFWPKDMAHLIPRRSAPRVEIAAVPSQPVAGATQSGSAPRVEIAAVPSQPVAGATQSGSAPRVEIAAVPSQPVAGATQSGSAPRVEIAAVPSQPVAGATQSGSAPRVEIAAVPSQPVAGATQSEAAPQIDTPQSNKGWFEWAVRNVPPADFKHGYKKRYAKKLEGILAQDAKKNEKLKPSPWTSISARLTERNLWPMQQTHEKTTK